MTLEEAIIHSREVAKEKRSEGCIECANEHEQLAEWLEELEIYKKALELACTEIDCSTIDDFYPYGWVCVEGVTSEGDWKCDMRCKHKDGRLKGSLSYDAVSCWCDYFIQKARTEE